MEIQDIRIELVKREDQTELTAVMKRSFDDDSQRHLGKEKGGPPGYDTGEFIRVNGFNAKAQTFKALVGGKIAGCIITFPGPNGHHWLGCMFTDPAYQRRGIGSRLFSHVEKNIPGKSWTLETPAFALSNHEFYEKKCGFKKIRETDGSEEPGVQFIYKKKY